MLFVALHRPGNHSHTPSELAVIFQKYRNILCERPLSCERPPPYFLAGVPQKLVFGPGVPVFCWEDRPLSLCSPKGVIFLLNVSAASQGVHRRYYGIITAVAVTVRGSDRFVHGHAAA